MTGSTGPVGSSGRRGARARSAQRRWPDRPVLVVAAAGLGVLTAAGLTLVLLPAPPDRRPTALPPPTVPVPAGTLSPDPAPTPSADGFTPVGGANAVSRRANRPSPPGPAPAPGLTSPPSHAGPPRLTPLPPSREPGLRSVTADRETAVQFVNARAEPVIVYWLDYRGHRVRYRVLGAGDSYRQHTYVTHPWVVTRLDGHAVVVFLPLAEPARATIR